MHLTVLIPILVIYLHVFNGVYTSSHRSVNHFTVKGRIWKEPVTAELETGRNCTGRFLQTLKDTTTKPVGTARLRADSSASSSVQER